MAAPSISSVFVSHASADRAFVESTLFDCLRGLGIEPWYSRDDIRTADEWERKLLEGLESCERFLLVMSPRSAESKWVRAEVHWAIKNRWPGRIIPVLIEDCRPESFHLWLSMLQYADFRADLEQARVFLADAFAHGAPQNAQAETNDAVLILPQPEAETTSAAAVRAAAEALKQPRFHCGGIVPPQYFIDREQELQDAEEIIAAQQSFLLVGVRRSGKSSFLKKLQHRLAVREGDKILSSDLNLEACRDLTIETFLGHTIINMIGAISREVFRIKPADLNRADPATLRPELANDAEFDALVNINRLVVQRTHTSLGGAPNTFVPDEFVGFATDLLDIIRARGWSHYVILYDEANHLPARLSVEVLEGNLEALHSAALTTVYAASPEMEESFRPLHDLFGHHIQVGAFDSQRDLVRLLARYYYGDPQVTADLPISANALQSVWDLAFGMPFQLQFLLNFSFQLARQQRVALVTEEHVAQAFERLSEQRPEYFPPLRKRS